MLGGEINWAGLPVVCEILGVNDIESLIHHLVLIRDFQNEGAHG